MEITTGAQEEYKTQKQQLLKALVALNAKVIREIDIYDKQTEDKPNSWAGLGKGGDLEDLIHKLKDIT